MRPWIWFFLGISLYIASGFALAAWAGERCLDYNTPGKVLPCKEPPLEPEIINPLPEPEPYLLPEREYQSKSFPPLVPRYYNPLVPEFLQPGYDWFIDTMRELKRAQRAAPPPPPEVPAPPVYLYRNQGEYQDEMELQEIERYQEGFAIGEDAYWRERNLILDTMGIAGD